MTVAEQKEKLTPKDFASSVEVRWCAGCGDYAILNAVRKTFPNLGIPKEKFVVVSGIGCSSRFPYYMNTYGFHTVHGRGPTFATGIKVANPELSVWLVTGDGDGLSIGGNHLMHIMRRNVNVNILLFNNRIYGLTKGQFSPTSEQGKKTKTSPEGSLENPVNPILFALSSGAGFVARTYDTNVKHMCSILTQAAEYPGVSFIEIWQNCPVFNNGSFSNIYSKDNVAKQVVFIEEGKELIYDNGSRGIFQKKFDMVTEAIDGNNKDDILVYDTKSDEMAYRLAKKQEGEFPYAVGVFREAPSRPIYEEELDKKCKLSQEKKVSLGSLIKGAEFWEVKENSKSNVDSVPKDQKSQKSKSENLKEFSTERVSQLLGDLSDQTITECLQRYGFTEVHLLPDDSLQKALKLMKDKKRRSLFVCKESDWVGLLSDVDVIGKIIKEEMNAKEITVEQAMKPKEQLKLFDESSLIKDVLGGLSQIEGSAYIPFYSKKSGYMFLSSQDLLQYLINESM